MLDIHIKNCQSSKIKTIFVTLYELSTKSGNRTFIKIQGRIIENAFTNVKALTLTDSIAYGTQNFNATFTMALQ